MQSIHISNSCLVQLPVRQPREPRERFVRYYRDLYSLHGKALSEDAFLSGSQYSYSELGDCVLSTYFQDDVIKNIDLLCIVTWAHEFDPDYASMGAYFAHHYQFDGKIFDVGDQGSIGFHTAIDLIKKYLETSSLQCALVLLMEQTTIPGEKDQSVLPIYNAAFGVLISKNTFTLKNNDHYEIIASGIEQRQKILGMDSFILSLCANYSIPRSQLKLIIKDNNFISCEEMTNLKTSTISINFVVNDPGIFPFILYLHELLEGRQAAEYVLMIDEDAESTDIGYLLIRSRA